MQLNIKQYIPLLMLGILMLSLHIPTSQARDSKGRFVIVIDPGHGGKDTGAIGRNSKEKNIVLDVALLVGEKIKAGNPNIVVHYTRSRDNFIGLKERTNFANRKKADLFLSIHANSVDNRGPKGAETYVFGLRRSDENLKVVMKENSAILYEEDHSVKYEGFDPNSVESYIIFQFIQNKHLDASIELADLVQKGLVSCGLYNRGVKQDVFLVLREAAMPSILVELGFISNADDEKYMMSKSGQNNLANKIANAVLKYERTMAKRSGILDKPEKKEIAQAKGSNDQGEIYYRVQVLADKREIPTNSRQFRKYKKHVSHYIENGFYKYTIYNTTDLNEAKKYQQELRPHFKDCFIVSFNAAGEKVGSYH